jgi:hypothetical protein
MEGKNYALPCSSCVCILFQLLNTAFRYHFIPHIPFIPLGTKGCNSFAHCKTNLTLKKPNTMKKHITIVATLLLFSTYGLCQPGIIFHQQYFDGGTAVTSTYSVAELLDYEAADNFSGLNEPIEEFVFYGMCLKHTGTAWQEMTPGVTEPFIIRFYNYSTTIFPGIIATATGTYKLALKDSYGDGWNGGKVTVKVNNVAVLTDITLASGFGPVYHDFSANAGDVITTVYVSAQWPEENYYAILDPSETIIAEQGGTWDNPGASVPGSLQPGTYADEPLWTTPISSYNLSATVTNAGTVFNGTYQLYKFKVVFPSPVNLTSGWISAQIDVVNGSGTWFLWLNSLAGDLTSFHRIPPSKSSRQTNELSGLNADESANTIRGVRQFDLGMEFWGGQLSTPPGCVTYITPANEAVNVPINTTLSWSQDPIAEGYRLHLGSPLPASGIDLGDVLSYQGSLQYSTTYQWKVVPYNELGDAEDCAVFSFTTMADPSITPPFTENFNSTPFPPLNWARFAGILTDNTAFVPDIYIWQHHVFGNQVPGTSNSAYVNVYGVRNHWLVTPPINLGTSMNYRLRFDIALTPWTGTDQTTLGPNDYLAVVISTDGGTTWSNANVLISWDASSNISPTGNEIIVSLAEYSGVVKLGFYCQRPSGSTPDLRFYVDNVTVEEIPTTPVFYITPNPENGIVNFGSVLPGDQSAPQNFVISNLGTGTLIINSVSLSGGDIDQFIATNLPASNLALAAGQSHSFSVAFAPTSLGLKQTNLQIQYNDGSQTTFTLLMTGTGFEATIPFAESFDTSAWPSLWTQTYAGNLTSNRWNVNNTSNAGGQAYEMRAAWASGTGTSRLIAPALNLTSVENVQLSFKHFLDDYGAGATFKIQSSSDGITWIDEDFVFISGAGNIGPTMVTVPITTLAAQTYIAWVIEGNHFQFDYWYIDDVVVQEAQPEGMVVDVKMIIEGAFDTSQGQLMQTLLNQAGLLPLSQPYAPALPYYGNMTPVWFYQGDESVAQMPANAVDWVVVELRDAASAAQASGNTVIAKKAGLLLNNGHVVGTDLQPLVFDVVVGSGLYVVVYHRNHLAAISAQALTADQNIWSWDFTVTGAAYINGCKNLGGGYFGLFGGDADADGQIQTQDKNNVWVPESGQGGVYKPSDFDLNGQVQTQDLNNIWNPNGGQGSAVPGSSR